MSPPPEVTLVADADVNIRPRTWFRFHVGTSEVGARIVSRDLRTGGPFSARLAFDEPVLLRAGDRFVIRTSAPLNTIAGGVITDPYAAKRARPWPTELSSAERLERLVIEAGTDGIEVPTLPVRLGETPSGCGELIAGAHATLVVVGMRAVSRSGMDALAADVVGVVTRHHAEHALEPGIPMQMLRSGLRWNAEIVAKALDGLEKTGAVSIANGHVALAGWEPKPTSEQTALIEMLLSILRNAGAEPPTVAELNTALGGDVSTVIRYLERRGDVVQVEADRYYAADQLKLLLERLRLSLPNGAEFSPSEIRNSLELSRKFLIPFLEYCDRVGYTNRSATGRSWRAS
jgi:selenocysteine-specific elongation factor